MTPNRTIYDFSEAKIHCSCIYNIVADGKERTPKQQYQFYEAVLAQEMAKYDEMGERLQGMKRGISKAAKIAGLQYELSRLEPIKHLDPLSKGAKSHLKKVYAELKFGKWSTSRDIGNKYVNKGKIAEQYSLELVSLIEGISFVKNEESLENEFICGIPDTFIGDNIRNASYICDVKTSWDIETFIDNLGKPLNPLYWWQLQGYFALTHTEQGDVSYCLVNTPDSLIEDEKYKLSKRMDALTNETPEYRLQAAVLENNLLFDDMHPLDRRIKMPVQRDDEAIKKIYTKVPLCREYLFELQEMHLTGKISDTEIQILDTIEEI